MYGDSQRKKAQILYQGGNVDTLGGRILRFPIFFHFANPYFLVCNGAFFAKRNAGEGGEDLSNFFLN